MTTPEPSSLSAEDTALVASRGGLEVSVAIKAQNPDLETAWRTIAWWEQTCAYWHAEAQKGYAHRDARADERRRAGEREAALRERVLGVLNEDAHRFGIGEDPECECDGCYLDGRVRAALAADEPEAAESGAERERVRHNHMTRDIKPPGICPACDAARREAQDILDTFPTPPGHDESPEAGAREESDD